MRQTFAEKGVIGYKPTDLDQVMADDESVAEQLDARRNHIAVSVAVDMAAEVDST